METQDVDGLFTFDIRGADGWDLVAQVIAVCTGLDLVRKPSPRNG
jgi:hypothetical protein